MMKNITAKKWCLMFATICLILFLVMGIVVYVYDPYCYYRIPEGRFIVNNYRFVNAGIAKNANYDTVIIGSSMTQNFKMESFRNKLQLNPIKLTVGGMSLQGMDLIYSQVCDIDKATEIYVCIDLPSLNKEKDELETYATYLYNDTVLDDYRYLLGYETWMRLLPLNLVFNFLSRGDKQLPSFYGTYNIDTIGEWDEGTSYDKGILIKNYTNKINNISKQDAYGIHDRMIRNSDQLLDIIYKDREKHITVFFPPYSALFWYQAQEEGYYDEYQEIKKYLIKRMSENENTTIYDFQCIPLICDLDNYKDITHYSGEVNEIMVEYFQNKKYIVTNETVLESIENLNNLIKDFKGNNSDWL